MNPIKTTMALLALLCLVACQSGGPERTAFLPEDIDLERAPELAKGFRWVAPDVDMTTYDSLCIEEVVWSPLPGAAGADIATTAAATFRQTLSNRLDPYYDCVDEPGAHVARLTIALTDIAEPTETAPGHVSIEGQAYDSVSGDRLRAFIDTLDLPAGSSIQSAFDQWADRLLAFMDEHHKPM